MKIVVGTTAAGHKHREASRWLRHGRGLLDSTPHEVVFFLAAEVQPSGVEPRLDALMEEVQGLGGEVWRFMIDDGSEAITNEARMVRICEGRNLITEFAIRERADWILYVDADIVIPADVINRLLELNREFCGFQVPSYCMSGDPVPNYDFPVQIYQNTAGAWFLHRSLFRFFRWLWDPDDGLTDDPATYRVIKEQLGYVQYNRMDVQGEHDPLVPFEAREADTGVQRATGARHPITAVIPLYFAAPEHVDLTRAILQRTLAEPVARIYVLMNGGTEPYLSEGTGTLAAVQAVHGHRLEILAAEGETIYQMWNSGWRRSLDDFGDEVLIAFLNNDIDFLPGTIELLARCILHNEIWVTFPDCNYHVANGARLTGRTFPTRGSKRHGGLSGHCFLIKGGIHTKAGFPLFDTRYHCWYGDDDFAFRVNQYGFEIHCVEGLPCDHINEATMRYRPDIFAKRDHDRERFVEVWGDI